MQDLINAIKKLDRGYNLVNLVELRKAVKLERTKFDAALMAARRARLLTCSGPERKITQEEAEAGIKEDGGLLLYVSVR